MRLGKYNVPVLFHLLGLSYQIKNVPRGYDDGNGRFRFGECKPNVAEKIVFGI